MVKASFVFDFLARNEESERRNRGVGGETLWRPVWCGGTITEQKLWSSFILYYNTSVLRSSQEKLRLLSLQLSSLKITNEICRAELSS